jgi:hypothetical protein
MLEVLKLKIQDHFTFSNAFSFFLLLCYNHTTEAMVIYYIFLLWLYITYFFYGYILYT